MYIASLPVGVICILITAQNCLLIASCNRPQNLLEPCFNYRPQRSWGKVMFLQVSVILSTGGCYPSMHCRWYPSMPCSRSPGGMPGPGGVPGPRGSGPGGCGLLLWPSVVVFCFGLLVWWPSD